ncbi:PspC domain-containing protein [Aliikangiella sp. IMCC44359]|uniref:PspC domain-containing protein n=1 Tax=Aliikangiella sp. IMCC44359 TaxID=3459125 RepID=UPI00403AC334
MNRYRHYQNEYHRVERPLARSKIMGVCAGVARQFGWDVTVVRIIAILCLFTFTAPTLLAYIIAGALFY